MTLTKAEILAAAKKAGLDIGNRTKKEMTDMVISGIQIITDSAEGQEGPLKVRFKGATANVVNANHRLYPRDVLLDAVERIKLRLPVVGESPHPASKKSTKTGQVIFDTKIENSVINITDVTMQGDDVFFDAEVLETAKGKDLRALIAQKVKVGDSMRSVGNSIQRTINGVMVDVATFIDIHSWDVVMNPATDGCGSLQVLTDSQIDAIIEDGIEVMAHSCPVCGAKLEGQKPDDDGDIDFYVCPNGHGPFVEDNSMTQTINASTTLRLITPDNYDRYGLAQEWLEKREYSGKKKMTDEKEGVGEIVKTEDLIRAMKEDPAVRAAVMEMAQSIAQPALDSVAAQDADKVKVQAKAEARAFLDEKMATLKGKYDDKAMKVITDSIGEPETKDMAQGLFDSAIRFASTVGAKAFTDSAGFVSSNASFDGHTRIEVGAEAKPWMGHVDRLIKEMDGYGTQFGKVPDHSIRKYNREMIDKIMTAVEEKVGTNVMADSVRDGKMRIMNDSMQGAEMMESVSVTLTQVLNQPTIMAAVIVQAFQDIESLQFVHADVFRGTEWRIPIETFTSAGVADPSSGLIDILVPESAGIVESNINLTWQSFSPSWRRNAISLTQDVVRALETGPANYPAIARAIYHISEDKRRKIDNATYYEMILASDEAAPVVIASEVATAENVKSISDGNNRVYYYNVLATGVAGATAGAPNPIVRPRTVNQIQPSGQVSAVVTNQMTVKIGAGTALVRGYLDGTGNIQGTNAVYAVDWEKGVVYFTSGAGLNPSAGTPVVPTLAYSAVANYDRWSYTVPTGVKPEDWYNTLLQQFTKTTALMGSSPRFKKPNLAVFSLNAATYIENAQIFYKLASPEGTRLIPTSNYFGERSGVTMAKINAPWVAGDSRILLTQKGSTRYGIETPYAMEGPFPKYDPSTGNIIDAKVWYGRENAVLATPQVKDTSGNIINPVSRTIILNA